MRVSRSVFTAFLAFVLGQLIQIIANAVAVSLYAYRPVVWCAFVAFATIVLVLLTLVVSEAEGEHIAKEKPMREIVEEYAEPPKVQSKVQSDNSKVPLWFSNRDLEAIDIDLE